MDWWNPDEQTRRALRRWAKVNPMRAERPMHWMPEEEFDREFYGEDEHENSDEQKLSDYG
jgi:hypothetical protein